LPEKEEITSIERKMLGIAIEKLNFVSINGRGESSSEDERYVFDFWLNKGRVRVVGNSRFGEIYELLEH
jgi:hypothetical protein